MFKRILLFGVAVLFAASVSLAGQKAKGKSEAKAKAKEGGSWSGWITDNHCGAKGANAAHAECLEKCIKKGGKYALYDTADKKLYELDNQKEAAEHGAHHVRVKGTLEGDTIHVASITMVGAKKTAKKAAKKAAS